MGRQAIVKMPAQCRSLIGRNVRGKHDQAAVLQENDTVYFSTLALHKLFPPGLSTLGRENSVRRSIQLANLWAKDIPIPQSIAISMASGELESPLHREAIEIEDGIPWPPRGLPKQVE